jgi:signal peptidase
VRFRPALALKTAGMLANIAFFFVMLLLLGVAVLPLVSGIELRNVVSGSMEPSIAKGAMVIAAPTNFDGIESGDVILFRAPGESRIITHRVHATHDDHGLRTLETRGDANAKSDPWRLSSGDVLGEVRADMPIAGIVVERIRTPLGFALLVAIPGIALMLGELPLWLSAIRRRGAEPVPQQQQSPSLLAKSAPERRMGLILPAAAIMMVAIAVTWAVGALTAPRSDQTRPTSSEAADVASIATHVRQLADGEAFDGDVALLRYAEDVRLRHPFASADEKATALRQALYINTNRFDALALVGLDGAVLAATDEEIASRAVGEAFEEARLTEGAATRFGSGLATYAIPVRTLDEQIYAVLVGWTANKRLWSQTITTTITGSVSFVAAPDSTVLASSTDVALPRVPAGSGTLELPIQGRPMLCAAEEIGSGTHFGGAALAYTCLPRLPQPESSSSFGAFLLWSGGAAAASTVAGVALLALLFQRRNATQSKSLRVQAMEERLLAHREPGAP